MQHGKIRRLAGLMLFLAIILPFMAHAAGTPTITSISGALTNGNTVAINGSNFIQMNTANWIPFFQNNPNASNFGGASPAADGYSTQGPQGGVYDTSFYIMGKQSMRFDVSGGSTTCPQDNLFNYNAILTGGGDAQDLWIRAYVAYNSANNLWFANQDKMFMCEGYGPGQYVYMPANWATLPSQMEADFDGMSHRANIPSGPIQNKRWYCMEVHWQTVAAPYVYQAWIDGVEIFNANPQTQGCLMAILFGLINGCGTTSGFSLSNWFDGFAVSTSRVYPASTIQVGNSPTYGQGNEQYQQPIYVNDNQVQFVLNTSAVGPGPYYLWITNNSQVRNAAYALQASSGSGSGSGSGTGSGVGSAAADPTGPTVPANLTATVVSSSQIDLSWAASTDSAGVAGYYVYENGVQIGSTTGTSYDDRSLSADTAYSFTVAAYDASGNVSAQSSAVSATTAASNSRGGHGGRRRG